MIIRLAQEGDRPYLRAIYLLARRKAWSWLNNAEWRLKDFDDVTRDEQIWVAVQDGRQIGFASVWTADNFLHNLFVDPCYQRAGAGSALLRHVQTTFTSDGTLKCLVKNERAVEFYQRHDWHIEATGDSPDGEYYLMGYRLG